MVIGFHLVWTAYGWWLPNDPRGSWSREVRVPRIAELGELHHGRKAVQPSRQELRAFHHDARAVLAHPVLAFTAEEVALLADSFRDTIRKRNYTCYACAIMPDHAHLLIRKHRDRAEQMVSELQDASRTAILAAGRWPLDHPVWGSRRGWIGFLWGRTDIERTIPYIEANPDERGLPRQTWDFVRPYRGWPEVRD